MMSARILLLLAITAFALGCVTGESQPVSPRPGQTSTLTGTISGGMMAIGGETTGWTLALDGAADDLELDVSEVMDHARRLEGKRVSVTGRMVDKQYIERGKVRMLRVERIEEAK